MILESVLLRREKKTKDADGKPIVNLPPKNIELKYLDLSNRERKIYEAVYKNAKEAFLTYLGTGTVLKNVTAILAILIRLRQAVLHPLLLLGKKAALARSAQEEVDLRKMIEEFGGDGFEALEVEKVLEGGKEEEECVMCLDVSLVLLFFIFYFFLVFFFQEQDQKNDLIKRERMRLAMEFIGLTSLFF